MLSASKVLGSMRALKFKLKRSTLNQIYISYMWPILEYASIVWDGCNDYEKDSLEKLEYEAARVVTGLTRSVSIDRLLKEIGWLLLSERRRIQKLVTVYNIYHDNAPSYVASLFPDSVADSTPYSLRNYNNYVTIDREQNFFSKSFIPSSLVLWNNLDQNIREADTLYTLKSRLRNKFNRQFS